MTIHRSPNYNLWTLPLALTLSIAGTAGCVDGDPSSDATATLDWTRSAALTSPGSCQDTERWLKGAAIAVMDQRLESSRQCFVSGQCYTVADDGFGQGSPRQPSPGTYVPPRDPMPYEYQALRATEGLDEGDRVKTDGTYVYTLVGEALVILDSSSPSETIEVGRIALRGRAKSLFINGDRAIVLGSTSVFGTEAPILAASHRMTATGAELSGESRVASMVAVIDLSDKSAPRVTKEHFFEGNLDEMRRSGDKVYLALTSSTDIPTLSEVPALDFPRSGNRPDDATIHAAFDALRDANVAAIRSAPLDAWLPKAWTATDGGELIDISDGAANPCGDFLVPSVYDDEGFVLTLVTVDTGDGVFTKNNIPGLFYTVYPTQDALYLATDNRASAYLVASDAPRPQKHTHIHKFAYDAGGNAHYVASGEVDGWTVRRFQYEAYALDELDGDLRVVTTDADNIWDSSDAAQRVNVLRQRGARLERQNAAPELAIPTVLDRVIFDGGRAYGMPEMGWGPIPIFDLSDPTNPALAGDLRVVNGSCFIHPLGDDILLVAGADAEAEPFGTLPIELVNAQDPSNPVIIASLRVNDGWAGWRGVAWDLEEFKYFPEAQLLTLPVSGWEDIETADGPEPTYRNELALFRVTPTTIEVLPRIDHMAFWGELGGHPRCEGFEGYWRGDIARAAVTGDFLYSFSYLGVQVHDLRDLWAGPLDAVKLLSSESLPNYDWATCEYVAAPTPEP